jgi:hypothetical protein
MYKFLLYYRLQSLGVFQQQLNRETTPQEHQLSMQDSTCKSQHQLRRGINPQQDTNLSTGTQPVYTTTHICTCACLYCNTHMYVPWPTVSLRTPSETRVSETSTFWPFRPFLPLSHPLLILSLHSAFHCPICTITNHKHIYAIQQPMHAPQPYTITDYGYSQSEQI